MTIQVRFVPAAVFTLMLLGIPLFAQSPAQTTATSQEQLAGLPPNANSLDGVAKEIGLLRTSLQTLNGRLRDISDRVLAPDAATGESDKQKKIALNLDLLTHTEQRAEILRKQLLELIEKETGLKNRLVQIEEDMRPENIERALSGIGSTRTSELRDARRRILDNERRGVDSLLNQTTQSRIRLEEDVRQADALVAKLRDRILPLIDKEIEKIKPN